MNKNILKQVERVCGKGYTYNDIPTYIRNREKKQQEEKRNIEKIIQIQAKVFKGLLGI